MKRTISIILCLVIIFSVFTIMPFSVGAKEVDKRTTDKVSGDYEYEILNDDTAEITKYNGSDAEVIIPSELNGKTVSSIGNTAFRYHYRLTSVIIPNSVKSIGVEAFNNCTSLTSVIIPNSVTSIGNEAFQNCYKLNSVIIPNSVTSIGEYAFYECSKLATVSISQNITCINEWTFACCYNLVSINIPDGITKIGNYAFASCKKLESIRIPNSVTSIGNYIFSYSQPTLFVDKYSVAYDFAIKNKYNYDDINNYFEEPISSSTEVHINDKKQSTDNWNIKLHGDFSIDVPPNIPIIGGNKIKIDMSPIPLAFDITNNKIRIGLGITDIWNDESTWCSFKNYCNGYNDNIKKGIQLFNANPYDFRCTASAGIGEAFKFNAFGYYEMDIVKGKLYTNNTGLLVIQIKASVSQEWQIPCEIPIVAKFKGEINADNNLSLSFDDNDKSLSISSDLIIELPKITASAGIGIAHIADVSLYGEVKNQIKWFSSPQRITSTLTGELGVSARALFFSCNFPIIKCNEDNIPWYDSFNYTSLAMTGKNINLYDESSYSFDKSYLNLQHSEFNNNFAETNNVLISDVYNNASPTMVTTKSNTILVWIDVDPSKAIGNNTVLKYSIYDKDNQVWSTPLVVEDNGTADFYPNIATDGENTYITWVDTNTNTFNINSKINEVASACEIKLAKFNSTSNKFENIIQITTNNTADILPIVSVVDKKPIVIWKNNNKNQILGNGGINTLYVAENLKENKFTTSEIISTDKMIYEHSSNGNYYAYSIDCDNNINTVEDIEIYGEKLGNKARIVSKDNANDYNLSFSNIDGKSVLTYQSNGAIYISKDLINTEKITDDNTMILGNYKFISNDNITKLYSVETIDNSTEIFSYCCDKGLWSNPLQLTKNKKYIRNFSISYCGDDLLATYLLTNPTINGDTILEATDLCSQFIKRTSSLKLCDIDFDSTSINPNKSLPLSINVSNNGTEEINQFKVRIRNKDSELLQCNNINLLIQSGETKVININFILPSYINENSEFYLELISNDESIVYDTKTINLGNSELEITTHYATVDNKEGILIQVNNNSCISCNPQIILKADNNDGDILDVLSTKSIDKYSKEYYFIDFEKIHNYNTNFHVLLVEIYSDKYEEALANNTSSIIIKNDKNKGDANKDGNVNISDATCIQQYLAKLIGDDKIDLEAATMTGPKLSISDATHIQQYLAHLIDEL